MALVEATLKQWGNSFGIIIPSDLVRRESLQLGDKLKVDIIPDHKIDAFGILRGRPSYSEIPEGHEDIWK